MSTVAASRCRSWTKEELEEEERLVQWALVAMGYRMWPEAAAVWVQCCCCRPATMQTPATTSVKRTAPFR